MAAMLPGPLRSWRPGEAVGLGAGKAVLQSRPLAVSLAGQLSARSNCGLFACRRTSHSLGPELACCRLTCCGGSSRSSGDRRGAPGTWKVGV